MALTQAQLATLKAAILADPVLAAKPMNSDGNFDIAVILNSQLATPDFFVWRPSVSVGEIMGNNFDWTRVDNMTVGESRIWEYMTQLGVIDPSKPNIRAGINEAYKGTAQDDAMRLAIFGHCQKLATRAQKLFATGTGTTTTDAGTGPATMAVESINASDVEAARNLP
jgi:hypothetical protein